MFRLKNLAWGATFMMIGSFTLLGQLPDKDWSVIRERLLDQEIPEWRSPTNEIPGAIKSSVSSLQSDGTWSDVKYVSDEMAEWKAMSHLNRISAMAKIYIRLPRESKERQDLRDGMILGIAGWIAKDPKSQNWWWNTIGAQSALTPVVLALLPEMPTDTKTHLDKIYELSRPENIPEKFRTSQNLVWLARRTMVRALLLKNSDLLKQSIQEVESEIRFSPKEDEGIKADFSFHMHRQQLYNGGYGRGFFIDTVGAAVVMAGTSMAFKPESIDLLSAFLLQGSRWMVYRGLIDHSTRGREIVRATTGAVGTDYINAVKNLALCSRNDVQAKEILNVAANWENQKETLEGNRYFPRSDYFVSRGTHFFFGVRMNSKRTVRAEYGNGENEQGLLLGDGVTWLYRGQGYQYSNIMPFWDWGRIPGVTAEITDPRRTSKQFGYDALYGSSDFTGGVANGELGVCAMELQRQDLSARKAWFFWGPRMVCLGAGISTKGKWPVETVIDQSLFQDGAITSEGPLGDEKEINDEGWCWHDNLSMRLYPKMVKDGKLKISQRTQSGSWKMIRTSATSEVVSGKVFLATLEQGQTLAQGTYGYGVVSEATPTLVKTLPQDMRVIHNDKELQVLAIPNEKVLLAVSYQSKEIKVDGYPAISVNGPVILALKGTSKGWHMTVSDPNQNQTDFKIVCTRSSQNLEWSGHWPAGDRAGFALEHIFDF